MKKKNENSRNIILKCALELFSERGYDGVGINEITEAAGITKPTLYYFFGNKEGLFEALIKEHYEVLHQELSLVCRYDPKPAQYDEDVYAVLCRLTRVYFSFAEQYREFCLMALSLTFAPPTSAAAAIVFPYHKVQYDLLEQIFCQFSEVHHNVKGKEKNCSWRFLAMVHAQIAFWYRGFASLSEAEARSLVAQFMHGIFS